MDAPSVFIGEKQLDSAIEARAEEKLSTLFPVVSVTTDANGARLIPIQEVFKMERVFADEVQKARQAGIQQGYQSGMQKGLEEAGKILKEFDRAIKDTVEQREALFEEARQEVLDLIVQISRKVTFDAVVADPEVTLEIINGVINTLVDRSKLKIKVNPDHLPIIEQNMNRFLKGSTSIKELSIEPDPRVNYGGCFIETPTGDIDARLESQFEVIEEALKRHEGQA